MKIYEACVGNITEAINAEKLGAGRIELCDNLLEGGTTPSLGTIMMAKKNIDIPVNVIIRPRGGDFVYNDIEIEVMKNDIQYCKDMKVNGIVIGALDNNNNINKKVVEYLLEDIGDLSVTFHMAFDEIVDPFEGIDYLVSLKKIDRILTRGGATTAPENLERLKEYVEYANNRIIILPGSGINKDNKGNIINYLNVKEVHGTKIVGDLK